MLFKIFCEYEHITRTIKKINLSWFLRFGPGTLTAIWFGCNRTAHMLLIKPCAP